MKAKSEYPTRHGDQHREYGSDPITGFIHWGENTDLADEGLTLISPTNSIDGQMSAYRFATNLGNFTIYLNNSTRTLISTLVGFSTFDLVDIQQQGSHDHNVRTGQYFRVSDNGLSELFTVFEDGNTEIVLRTGTSFSILDHTGSPIFVWNEDGTVTMDGGGP